MSAEERDEAAPLEDIRGEFTDVAEAELVPPEWVIENVLPTGLIIVGGPPKVVYKSAIATAWGALVAGYECTVFPPHMSKVIQGGTVFDFSGEATAGEVRHMMEEGMGLELTADESFIVADDPWRWQLDDDARMEKLLWWMEKRDPTLVIIDPLRNFHSQEEKDSGVMTKMLAPLREWAKRNHACLVLIHHTTKPGEDHKKYTVHSLRGTGALFGMADGVHMLTPTEGKPGLLKWEAIFKRAKGWEREVQLGVWGLGTAAEVLDTPSGMILNTLKVKGKLTADDIGQATGLRKSVGPYVAKLEEMKLIRRDGRLWVLTEEGTKR